MVSNETNQTPDPKEPQAMEPESSPALTEQPAEELPEEIGGEEMESADDEDDEEGGSWNEEPNDEDGGYEEDSE